LALSIFISGPPKWRWLNKDLESTQAELDKALEYQQNLKPVCLEVHVSFEERAAARQAEIAALKEAYGVLDQKA
jgi:hypothetical protein